MGKKESTGETAKEMGGKKQKRLIRNRELAKDYRKRCGARISDLEKQVKELGNEANQLREVVKSVGDRGEDDSVVQARALCFAKLRSEIATPTPNPDTIVSLMDELSGAVGTRGSVLIESMRNFFQRTVSSILPEPLLLCLALNDSQNISELLQSSLSPELYSSFLTLHKVSSPLHASLNSDLHAFKSLAAELWSHADTIQSLIFKVKVILRPEQIARCALRVYSQFQHLKAEEVLNFGQNSMEVLNDEHF